MLVVSGNYYVGSRQRLPDNSGLPPFSAYKSYSASRSRSGGKVKNGGIVFQAGLACVFSTACFCGELRWRHVVQAAVWPPFVVVVSPVGDDPSCFKQVLEPADAQAFLAQLAVETLHVGILCGLARLDMHQIDLAIQRPGEEVATGQLRPVAPREAIS